MQNKLNINNELLHKQKNYSDEYKINDKNAYDNLVKMALDIANSDNTYKKDYFEKVGKVMLEILEDTSEIKKIFW